MKYKFVYKTVTALMLTITLVKTVLAEKGDDDRVSVQYSARPLTFSKKPIITKEDQWWSDYQSSKNNIVKYVHDISKSNPEAAAWFLLTGGKNGFANRQATSEEEKLLMVAVNNIAPTFTKIDRKNEWMTPIRSENPVGKAHYEIILKQYELVKIDEIIKRNENAFADQLREMREKSEKEHQAMLAKFDREREEIDRQREEDHEKHLEAMDKNYVRLSRFYTPEGLQKSKQHKKAMEDFRDYYKGLMETLKDKIDYTKESLNPLLGFETSNNAKKLRKVVKLVKEIARTRDVESFVFDSEKPSKDELSEARSVYYDKKRQLTSHWGDEKRRLTSEWHKIYSDPTASKKQKDDAYQYLKLSEAKIWEDLKKAEKEADESYAKLQQKVRAEKDQASQAETSKVLAQYGSVRKANQERLKTKYAEWQTKHSTLEALGIATSSEIIETVNNAFSGLLTTADMRDGLIETLEKRAEDLERTAAREARAKEILKSFKMKELQVKARLYNKNYRKGFSNDSINEWIAGCFKVDVPFERIETVINERLTA